MKTETQREKRQSKKWERVDDGGGGEGEGEVLGRRKKSMRNRRGTAQSILESFL